MAGTDAFSQSLQAAYEAAPSLASSPSLLVGAASSNDPTQTTQDAQTIGAAAEYHAAQSAMDKVQHHSNWLGSLAKVAGSVI